MAKKAVEKSDSPNEKISARKKNINVERALVENFVALQRVMADMSANFENLSGRISKLLDLFEMSAKTLAERGDSMGDKEIKSKLDSLLDQNKVLARGIAMLHDGNSTSEGSEEESEIKPYSSLPQAPKRIEGGDGYQKSVYSKP